MIRADQKFLNSFAPPYGFLIQYLSHIVTSRSTEYTTTATPQYTKKPQKYV